MPMQKTVPLTTQWLFDRACEASYARRHAAQTSYMYLVAQVNLL